MTTLLSAVWSGAVLSADQTAFVARGDGESDLHGALRSGFPFADVVVAGKTGTLGAVRNEVGVIEFPDGDAFAVAVFTRAARADALLPRADAAIGQARPAPRSRNCASWPDRAGAGTRSAKSSPRQLEWRKRSREPTSPAAAVNHSQSCPQV